MPVGARFQPLSGVGGWKSLKEEKRELKHLMHPVLGVASYGWPLALALVVLASVLWWVVPFWVALIPAILGLYVLYFFRDPERQPAGIPNSICSPADGRVASVVEVPCDRMPGGKARRVAIFLNIFNVHVQRSPIKGTVTEVERRPGKCLNALNEKCSEENEAVTIWLATDFGPIGVRQISGAIARRIVCHAEKGNHLDQAARYGLIQFGSRVELFMPMHCTVKVQPGQTVSGGRSCIALAWEEAVKKGKSSSDWIKGHPAEAREKVGATP